MRVEKTAAVVVFTVDENGSDSAVDPGLPRPAYPDKDFGFRVVTASLCACCFVSALDTIILSSTLPAIAASLEATTADAYWCSSAFLFAQSVVQLIYAAFAKALDRRICMLVGLAIFAVASVLCAMAQDVQWLIAARTLQGTGSGGTNALVQLILTDLVPLAERPKYTGLITLFAAAALVSGGLCGAAIVESASWRIIFWINLPVLIPAFIGFAVFLHPPPRQGVSAWTAVKRTDWAGLGIVTASLAGILFALNSGNAVYPWTSGAVLGPLVAGCAGLCVFVAYEHFVAGDAAILPGRLFANLTAVAGYVMTVFHAMITWTALYYFFLYLTFCSHSYLGAAVLMLPATLTFPLSAGVAGIVIGRNMRHRVLNVVAFLLIVSGLTGFACLDEASPLALQIPLQVMVGIGCGIPFISKVFMAQAAVDEADVLMATAIVATATSVGECFGVAVASSAFQNRWDALLASQVGALSVVIHGRDAEKSAGLIAGLDAVTRSVYQGIAVDSLRVVWIIMAALAGGALVLVVLARDTKREPTSHCRKLGQPAAPDQSLTSIDRT